jgi:hypothetical protein
VAIVVVVESQGGDSLTLGLSFLPPLCSIATAQTTSMVTYIIGQSPLLPAYTPRRISSQLRTREPLLLSFLQHPLTPNPLPQNTWNRTTQQVYPPGSHSNTLKCSSSPTHPLSSSPPSLPTPSSPSNLSSLLEESRKESLGQRRRV